MNAIAGTILVGLLLLTASIWAIGSVAILFGLNAVYVLIGLTADKLTDLKNEIFHPEKKWAYFRIFILVMLSIFVLTGCCTPPPPVVVEKVTIVKQHIPEAHLLSCKAPTLFSRDYFLSLDPPAREELLTTLSLDFGAALSKCNEQITQIRKLNNDSQ